MPTRLGVGVVAAAGRLDCLVNAAGLWTEGPADETREDDFDRVLGVNLKGLYFLSSSPSPIWSAPGAPS